MLALDLGQWLPLKFQISELVLPLGRRELQLWGDPGDGIDTPIHASLCLDTGREEPLILDRLYQDPPHPSWYIWGKYKAPQPRPWSGVVRQLSYWGFNGDTIAATKILLTKSIPESGFVLGRAPLHAGVLLTAGRLRPALFTETSKGDAYIVDAVWTQPTANAIRIHWLSEANEGKWWWPDLRQPSSPLSTPTPENLALIAKFFTSLGFKPDALSICFNQDSPPH